MSARDDRRLRFTCCDGNGKVSSMGQLAAAAEVGFLLIDFETPNRLRVPVKAAASGGLIALTTTRPG